MLDNFIYEDHNGRRFVGLDNRVYLNYNDLRNYSWSYDTINSKISRFYKPVTSRTIPLLVNGATDEEAVKIKNRLLELAETDIEATLPGKVYIGEYYTRGYITGSKKSNYLINKRICNIELTLTCEDPSWYREKTYSFIPGAGGSSSFGSGADYPYDYTYDYMATLKGQTIVCDNGFSDNAFYLRIYGPITDPTVIIAGHIYSVKGTVGAGESLLIDSLNKTVTLTTSTGSKINWFDKRGRESYIFEPIPRGMNNVSWTGDFGFELTIIEKRSEPKWT